MKSFKKYLEIIQESNLSSIYVDKKIDDFKESVKLIKLMSRSESTYSSLTDAVEVTIAGESSSKKINLYSDEKVKFLFYKNNYFFVVNESFTGEDPETNIYFFIYKEKEKELYYNWAEHFQTHSDIIEEVINESKIELIDDEKTKLIKIIEKLKRITCYTS